MTNARVAPLAALADATYAKSARSTGTGNCVAVAYAEQWVGIQDTKQGPDSTRRTTLAVPIAAFSAFLDAARTGVLH
ncbi:MAG: DUF397 domain-containing protein [Pseudonocardiales bacterium]